MLLIQDRVRMPKVLKVLPLVHKQGIIIKVKNPSLLGLALVGALNKIIPLLLDFNLVIVYNQIMVLALVISPLNLIKQQILLQLANIAVGVNKKVMLLL